VSKPRITIQGRAAVYLGDDRVTEPDILRSLDGLTCDDETFTDFIGGTKEEDVLAAALEKGGILRFGYDGSDSLTVTTEYQARRSLSEEEMQWLVDYTLGQWTDGIGENWDAISVERCGFGISCLFLEDDVGTNYPWVEVVEEPTLHGGIGEV
jgi:hypothetical protein